MSLVLTMTSLTILAGVSLTELSAAAIAETVLAKKQVNYEEGLETVFTDSAILYSTLTEYDLHVEKISENEYTVQTENGVLRYYRSQEEQAFSLYLDQIDNPEGLLQNIAEFEKEYGRNVQNYTYDHIKNNLSDNMRIYSEEVVDDELVVTINVD